VPAADQAVSAAEAATLFASLKSAPALLLAVSGGPDSSALMLLAARWRATLASGPKLFAATVDHRLRPHSAGEARAVGELARRLGIPHRTLRWDGGKPQTGLQAAARAARYRLLARAARAVGAAHIVTGHTLDDQAETVLLRMARGSGLTGLCAMVRETPLAQCAADAGSPRRKEVPLMIVRPLLDVPKARLMATLDTAEIAFADDPSNRDPRFTRARLRQLMPMLAGEGLSARRLVLLAQRLQRADAAIESAVDAAASETARQHGGSVRLDAEKFIRLPAEVALRLLGRAIEHAADEAPLRLGRLESLYEALARSQRRPDSGDRVRRTLAGALVTLSGGNLTIEPAPPRARPANARRRSLTTRIYGHAREA
jgi:tRNA(Ile)-lysidine synthase